MTKNADGTVRGAEPRGRRNRMKSTGMVRPVDTLGRIVLPIEIRKTMELAAGDAVEIFTDGSRIVLQKYRPGCIFCGNVDDLTLYKGKLVCADCIRAMKEEK